MRSTWDRVTPDLRAIAYRIDASTLNVRFIYAYPLTDWTSENVAFAETECSADFWPTHQVSFVAEHVPVEQPRELGEGEAWAFVRYEMPSGLPIDSRSANLDEVQSFTVNVERMGDWWEFTIPELDAVGQAREFSKIEAEARGIAAAWLNVDESTVDVTIAPRRVELDHDEALVLDALLDRWQREDRDLELEPGEQSALWSLSASLERVLTETFDSRYSDLLEQPRQRLREQGGE